MAGPNYDWVVQQLDHLLALTETMGSNDGWPTSAGTDDQIVAQLDVVETILERFYPDWRTSVPGSSVSRWGAPREAALRCKERILRAAEIRENLGDGSPELDAGSMHPWVWPSAAPLWSVSHQAAVVAVAQGVNTQVRNLLGSTLSEAALFNDAYSEKDPTVDHPRFRFPGQRDQTWQSRMNGARGLGQACFQGVRNVGAHSEADWSEQEALEYLAMFSALARWVQECEVERA